MMILSYMQELFLEFLIVQRDEKVNFYDIWYTTFLQQEYWCHIFVFVKKRFGSIKENILAITFLIM